MPEAGIIGPGVMRRGAIVRLRKRLACGLLRERAWAAPAFKAPAAKLLSFLAVLVAAPAYSGQGGSASPVRGWSVIPLFEVAGVYDDNLLFGPRGSQEATYTRLSGSFGTQYLGLRNVFSAGYSLSSELFPDRLSALTTFPSRQRASVDYSTQFNPRTGMRLRGEYFLTYSPNEILEATGIELGRRRSERYSAGVGFSRNLTERHTLSAAYDASHYELGGEPAQRARISSLGHSVVASWGHNHTERSNGSLSYGAFVYTDDREPIVPGADTNLWSHFLTYSWNYQLTTRAAVSISGGPRAVEQPIFFATEEGLELEFAWKVVPEVRGAFSYQWERAAFSIGYARTQNQTFGRTGRVDTESLSLRLTMAPSRRLSISLTPGVYRNRQLGQTADTFRAGADVQYQVAPWLALRGGYGFRQQQRFLPLDDVPIGPEVPSSRNTAFIGIVVQKLLPLD